MFSIKGDNLPKRSTCQIISFKLKTLKSITNWLTTSRNKLEKKNMDNKTSIFFSMVLLKFNYFKKKTRISFPFSSKILNKNIVLIVNNSSTNKKKKYFEIRRINSIGLIVTKKFLLKKYNQLYIQRQIVKSFGFLCIEEPLNFNDNLLILKLMKKFNIFICSFKFKQNFIYSIVSSCASLWVNLSSSSSFQVHLNNRICNKKLFNNILQIIGGIFDIFPGGFKNNKEIGIKNSNSFLYL